MQSATQTVTVQQQQIEPTDLNAAIMKMTNVFPSQVEEYLPDGTRNPEQGIHEGCEIFMGELRHILGGSIVTRVEVRDDLTACMKSMRAGGESRAERLRGDRRVTQCFKTVTAGIKMAEGDVRYEPESGREGRQPKIMTFHKSTYEAYHTSRNMSSDMRDELFKLTEVNDGEGNGPMSAEKLVKFKASYGLKKDGVTYPTLRARDVEVGKKYITDLQTKLPGDLPIEVR